MERLAMMFIASSGVFMDVSFFKHGANVLHFYYLKYKSVNDMLLCIKMGGIFVVKARYSISFSDKTPTFLFIADFMLPD